MTPADLAARRLRVKPLVWVQMRYPSGELHASWSAKCPLFGRRFWAESKSDIPRVEAKRAARVAEMIEATESAPPCPAPIAGV
jgi:hypothetical protein